MSGRKPAADRKPELSAVSKRIREVRNQAGISQAELARRAGISLDAVNRIETDRRSPNLSTLFKLADALGTHPAKLLGEPGPKSQYPPAVARLASLLAKQPDAVVKIVESVATEVIEALPKAIKGK